MKATRQPRSARPASPAGAVTRARRALRPASEPVIELVPAMLKLRSILVPVDLSGPSRKALVYAARFAEQFGAQLSILNVIEPVASADFAYFPLAADEEELIANTRGRLEQFCRRQKIDPRLVERTLVRLGTPFHEICSAAATLKADLIVLATHGHTGLKHVWLGSTAERVVRHAPCPVLVVRAREHEIISV